MFEMFYWSSVLSALSKLPRGAIIAVAGSYVSIEVYRRYLAARIALAEIEADSSVKAAQLEIDALKLKVKLQNTGLTNT